MRKRVLVVGGAGYIGSHVAALLAKRGYRPVVVDDMSDGHRWAVRGELLVGSTLDFDFLAEVMSEVKPLAIMHFAAKIQVAESMEAPDEYITNNVFGTLNLLRACSGVPVVFSSSAAVYGEPSRLPIPETHPAEPTNPYGESKLMAERALWAYRESRGLRFAALRYFNAAGAWPREGLGECHRPETHLIPRVLISAIRGEEVLIFGGGYPTPDGTAVRDFVHVVDLAEAHVLALEALLDGEHLGPINLGSGQGYTVLEVVKEAERVTGKRVRVKIADPRPGDPARLVASRERAGEVLGWAPRRGLDEIIRDAWEFYTRFPERIPP